MLNSLVARQSDFCKSLPYYRLSIPITKRNVLMR